MAGLGITWEAVRRPLPLRAITESFDVGPYRVCFRPLWGELRSGFTVYTEDRVTGAVLIWNSPELPDYEACYTEGFEQVCRLERTRMANGGAH